MSTAPLRIGIVGLGTVGTGVVKILENHGGLIAARTGRRIEIGAVSARDKTKARGVDLTRYRWADDPLSLVQDQKIDAVVELAGGADGIAGQLVRACLKAGKPVVTANKALLARHGFELAQLAETQKAPLLYEAAVAGGIPIIKALREGLAANDIRALYGILNGTCNYILTEMRETGKDFGVVLKAAQTLGYAEADPSFDIDGIDAAHKLCLLSALAFGHRPDFEHLPVTGIRHVSAKDIAFAGELGYRIKLLGIARRVDGRIMQRVEPCLVPADKEIAGVEGVFNAVFAETDFADDSLFIGRGAGEGPAASAVVSDLVDLARGHNLPVFGLPAAQLAVPEWIDDGAVVSEYYARMVVLDKPGVLADISAILRDHSISVESLLQRGRDPGKPVSIVMTTHPARHADMMGAAQALASLKSLSQKPCVLRIETF